MAFAGFLFGFGRKVWEELEPQWAKQVAGWIESRMTPLIEGYGRRYARHLYYSHRTFDVKGFSTQGKFALELESVYVELAVDPSITREISQNPTRMASSSSNVRDIITWLRTSQSGQQLNFGIIGAPGSGKTTMLKHLALITSARSRKLKAMPILLFLRDHAATIGSDPTVSLIELLSASLKDLPPPKLWFDRLLNRGKCLVMFDGLDEVADPSLRNKVVTWVEHQVSVYGSNRFLVSSRPNGYRENPLSGFTVLRVLPFNREQVDRFVRNWYLANELASYQKDDPGVRSEAARGAHELLTRLLSAPALQELGVNPLLLTLIATVHRYRSKLPGRRVELFSEICDVFLGKRQMARGIETSLTPAQKIRVLRVLAYEMMCLEVRELSEADAGNAISETLKLVMPGTCPSEFLKMVEDSSGLLVERESGVYGFAHLIFQEYLASLHVKEEKLLANLSARIGQSWWHETIRLYSAQADSSPILEKCLEAGNRITMPSLVLASECAEEALELKGELREKLLTITVNMVEHEDIERRTLAAEYMLARRTKSMLLLAADRYVDDSPISCAEYQLFLNAMRSHGKFLQPDHWTHFDFPNGTGQHPITGIRKTDAKAFCNWLTERDREGWTYSLAGAADTAGQSFWKTRWPSLDFVGHDEKRYIKTLSGYQIVEQIYLDSSSLQSGPEGQSHKIDRRLAFYWLWDYLCTKEHHEKSIFFCRVTAPVIENLHNRPRTLVAFALAHIVAGILDRQLDQKWEHGLPLLYKLESFTPYSNLGSIKVLSHGEDYRNVVARSLSRDMAELEDSRGEFDLVDETVFSHDEVRSLGSFRVFDLNTLNPAGGNPGGGTAAEAHVESLYRHFSKDLYTANDLKNCRLRIAATLEWLCICELPAQGILRPTGIRLAKANAIAGATPL
jgi:energy-coupling factor transporter ATP-binding protein EcfA2